MFVPIARGGLLPPGDHCVTPDFGGDQAGASFLADDAAHAARPHQLADRGKRRCSQSRRDSKKTIHEADPEFRMEPPPAIVRDRELGY